MLQQHVAIPGSQPDFALPSPVPSQTLKQLAAIPACHPAKLLQQLAAIPGAQPDFAAACCETWHLARLCNSLLQYLASSQRLQQPAAVPGTQPNFAPACCGPWCPARHCSSLLRSSQRCRVPSQTLQQLAATPCTCKWARVPPRCPFSWGY